MSTHKIYNENGQGFMRVFSTDKVEKVNPIEHYRNHEIQKRATVFRDLLNSANPFLSSFLDDDFYIKKAEEDLGDFFNKFDEIEVHKNFLDLLETPRKKDQERLLRNMTLNPDQLMSLIIKSYRDYGFLYSKYLFENLPNGFENKKMPKLFHLNNEGKVEKFGETDLTDGELKRIIEQRTVIVAHFFEKEDLWHCFFLTYNSLAGKENHNAGQPHFHYISSGFAISKEEFIESMRTGNYKSTSIHFDLLEYGNQPKNI